MKKALSLVLALVLVLALAACGGAASSTPTADTPAESTPEASSASTADASEPAAEGNGFKVAMLLPGTINDAGWNASAYEGLMAIEQELGAEVTYTEKVAASDIEEVFRGYAEMGYDLIIGHGYEYGDGACAVAPNFPESFFAITSSDVNQEPNVCGLQNRNDQQGFLSGALAALETQSGTVGAVGGMEIPSITAFMDGFQLGADYVNENFDKDVKVLANYTGNFDDVAAAKQMAEAMIAEGADIVTHDANQAGLGVFEAVQAASGVRTIGAVGDQYEEAPDVIITSAMSKLSDAILLAAEMAEDGQLKAQGYYFGVAEGTVYLADYRDAELSEDTQATMVDILAKLESGDIVVPILGAQD